MDYFDFHTNKNDRYDWKSSLTDPSLALDHPSGFRASLYGGFGDMDFRCYDFSSSGFTIWVSHYDIHSKRTCYASMASGVFELNIQMLNQEGFRLNGQQERFMRSGQYNFYYHPYVDNIVGFQAGQQYLTFDIHFSLDFIASRQIILPEILGPMLDAALQDKPASLLPVSVFMPMEVHFLVKEILQLLSSPAAHNEVMVVHAVRFLTVKLLTHGWGLLQGSFQPFSKSINIQIAERTLLDDLHDFISLPKLCQIAGLNKNDLERYFKNNFGKSVYDYWNDYRLTMAFESVVHTNKSFFDISEEFGFQDQSSFSRAFKNRFKVTPSDLRKTAQ